MQRGEKISFLPKSFLHISMKYINNNFIISAANTMSVNTHTREGWWRKGKSKRTKTDRMIQIFKERDGAIC